MKYARLARLSRYIELVFYKTYADLRAETERTYLGFLWWILEPIMHTLVFYVVFAVFLGHQQDDFVPFLLVGLTVWQWMMSCLTHGSESILGYRVLMQQVYLPKVLFPIILILTDSVKFIFIFVVLLIYLWLSGFSVTEKYLALPLLLIAQLLFICTVTFLLAAIVPFLPDLRFVVEKVLQAAFFASGIFFNVSSIPEQYHFYFYLNPMASLIEGYRQVLMYDQWPNWTIILVIAAMSVVGTFLSFWLIRRFEYTYPKVTI